MTVVADSSALLSGRSWTGGPTPRGVVLTYSFDAAPTPNIAAAAPGGVRTFQPLTAAERVVVRAALAQWSAAAGVLFLETQRTPGDLRFGTYAFAAFGLAGTVGAGASPSTGLAPDAAGLPQLDGGFDPGGGDVEFDAAYAAATVTGDFLHVALHEIGHALGLKHPFSGNPTLRPDLDDGRLTVMSYDQANRATRLGPLDIAAAQSLYGPAGTAGYAAAWNPGAESLTVIGSARNDMLFGSAGPDVIFGGGGMDAAEGAEGDDWFYAAGAPMRVDGGPGTDTVVTGVAYAGFGVGPGQVGGTDTARVLHLGAGTDQVYTDVERLSFTNGVLDLASGAFTPAFVGLIDASGTARASAPDAIGAASPNYLQFQYIYGGKDDVALSTITPNVFLHGGAGNDALQVTSGFNVLDGGAGSNFLTGGSGTDTFFTDASGASIVWNTVRNFHAGDAATLWGFVPGVSTWRWDDALAGAAGAQGATLRVSRDGGSGLAGDGIDASITFAGLDVAQARQLQLVTGAQAAGSYLYVFNPGV